MSVLITSTVDPSKRYTRHDHVGRLARSSVPAHRKSRRQEELDGERESPKVLTEVSEVRLARLRPRPDAAPPKNGENNGRGRPICGLPLDHRRSKSDCDWTPVEDEGDHTASTDLNSASPFPQSPVLKQNCASLSLVVRGVNRAIRSHLATLSARLARA